MKLINLLTLSFLLSHASAFVAPLRTQSSNLQSTMFMTESSSSSSQEQNEDSSNISRRDIFWKVGIAASLTFLSPSFAGAEEASLPTGAAASAAVGSIKKVVVAGATGQTGSRILNKLLSEPKFTTTGGVRNAGKASKALGTSVSLKHLDVVEDSLETLTATLKDAGADGLVIACGMNPSKNLLRMSAAAHEVDNVGTCKLIDAAKLAGIKKVVLVSSILTNGREWGQEDSAGFKITNAFGGALDEKLVAEKYLRASGLDYTIVRPGGLQAKPPTGALSINAEDTLFSGEISRDLVADVCIASLNDPKASNKVLEIIENEGTPPKVFNGLSM
eukprot:scaffold588_cov282-Chaetoceros_neogracile.AAC.13